MCCAISLLDKVEDCKTVMWISNYLSGVAD